MKLTWRLDPEESFSDWKIIIQIKPPVESLLPSSVSSSLESTSDDLICSPDDSSQENKESEESQGTITTNTYNVHKCILGLGERKSEYFCTIFKSGRMAESNNQASEIPLDHQAANAFPIMLDYMYEGKTAIKVTSENVMPLGYLADYFQIPPLSKLLECELPFVLNDKFKNFHRYMEGACAYNLEKPLEHLVTFCAKHFDSLDTEGLQKLSPELLKKIISSASFRQDKYSNQPKSEYMERQNAVDAGNRAYVVNYMFDFENEFFRNKRYVRYVHMAVKILDFYLSKVSVEREKLMAVGIMSVLVATKFSFHDERAAKLEDFVYYCKTGFGYTYRPHELDLIKQTILKQLQENASNIGHCPTRTLDYILQSIDASDLVRQAANYYHDSTLMELHLIDYHPSMLCAAAVVLALNNPYILRKENKVARLVSI